MPDLEDCDRYQKAVYLPRRGYNVNGEALFDTPDELDVRWEYTRREMTDPQGKPVIVEAVVVVGQDILMDSLMWLGPLGDFPGAGTGFEDDETELMQVKAWEKVPSIDNRSVVREVGLVYYKQTLTY